jgi:hypothetical protein
MNNEEIKLLPCPFCGANATIIARGIDMIHYGVVCTKCPAELLGYIKNKLVKTWNTRVKNS